MQISTLNNIAMNIINTAPCIVFWTNSIGVIEGCNDYLKKLIQKEIDFENQKITCENLGLKDLHEHILHFIADQKTEISFQMFLLLRHQNYYYKITLNKLVDQNKISVIGIDLTDDTEKQNMINEIHAKAVQTSKLAVLGEMAAGIAHEINNPLMILTSVTFVIQRLIEQSKFELVPERLAKIQSTINRISRIVNGLRMFARDGTNDPMIPVEVAQIINESLELCIENIRYKSIDVDFINLTNIPIFVDCRATQISQVLLNLMSNATDAVTHLNEKWIKITLEKINTKAVIKVIDSGNGISKEASDRIFQPFYTTKEVGSGTGLGLSISRGIIQDHNGKIYIDHSHVNTCLVIELPVSVL